MKIYLLLAAYIVLAGQTKLKQETPPTDLPSDVIQMEEMNPSPNPVPQENESDVFRGSTINHRAVEAQEEDARDHVKNNSAKEKPKKK